MVNEETNEYYVERAFIELIKARVKGLRLAVNVVGFNFEDKKKTKVVYPAVLVHGDPFVEYAPGAGIGEFSVSVSCRTHTGDDKNRTQLRLLSKNVLKHFDVNALNANFADLPENYLSVHGVVEEDSDSGEITNADTFEKVKNYKVVLATNLN